MERGCGRRPSRSVFGASRVLRLVLRTQPRSKTFAPLRLCVEGLPHGVVQFLRFLATNSARVRTEANAFCATLISSIRMP
jgi:hypothetical protein